MQTKKFNTIKLNEWFCPEGKVLDFFSINDQIVSVKLSNFFKAFDTLNYILQPVFHYVGFAAPSMQLLRNYLTDHFQYVHLHNGVSSLSSTASGIPQDSILGPVLFTIYIPRLTSPVRYPKLHNYADETQLQIFVAAEGADEALEHLNENLVSVKLFAEACSLKLNPDKSCVMIFPKGTQNIKSLWSSEWSLW